MKNLYFFLIVLMCGVLSAQTGNTKKPIGLREAGSPALLFSFRGLDFLSLNSYGGGIGGKYFLSPNMAIRGSLDLDVASETIPVQLDTGQTGKDGELSGSEFGVGAGIEIHLSDGRVRPYIGAGGSFRTSSTESKSAVIDPNPQLVIKNDLNGERVNGRTFFAQSSFGFSGFLGFEFFIVRNVSLAGEYELGYFKNSSKDQEATFNNQSQTVEGGSGGTLAISSQGQLTLAVYFR